MSEQEILTLREREKELNCLYEISKILFERTQAPADAFMRLLNAIPAGWQRPNTTGARIEYLGRSYVGPGYVNDGNKIVAKISLWGVDVGYLEVSDSSKCAVSGDAGSFLAEEEVLLKNIAGRLSEYLEWKNTELLHERTSSACQHWRWRMVYAQSLASNLDYERFGVSSVYLGGSTEAGTAGPGSDIDLYLVFHGSETQRHELSIWIEGWSLCLSELSNQKTGFKFENGLINVHWLGAPPNLALSPNLREIGSVHSRNPGKVVVFPANQTGKSTPEKQAIGS